MTDPVSVGDAAAMVGAELGLAEPAVFTKVIEAWPDLVGDALAAHSRVRSVRNGVVEIAVDSPAWATEFRYREREVVELVSRLVGADVVGSVRVTVEAPGTGPGTGGSTGPE